MDSILADDFILVTGSGKTYTKADLLEESRSARVHYERQEIQIGRFAFGAKLPW